MTLDISFVVHTIPVRRGQSEKSTSRSDGVDTKASASPKHKSVYSRQASQTKKSSTYKEYIIDKKSLDTWPRAQLMVSYFPGTVMRVPSSPSKEHKNDSHT
jgi:hypothetical protein